MFVPMHFNHGENTITIIKTEDITTDNETIFKYTVFNAKGQIINTGEVAATRPTDAKYKLLEHKF